MVKLDYIHLQKLEGLERESIVYSFHEVNSILQRWATEDSPEIGYNKVRIELIYKNSDKLVFRFDLSKNYTKGVDITDFIRNELQILAGLKKPMRLTEEQYQEFLRVYTTEEDRQKTKEILENYQLED